MEKPYSDIVSENRIMRTFDQSVSDEELVWHRDDCDRIVEIIKSDGWMFQYDNELPFHLREGDFLKIKEGEWHRTIKGEGDLTIIITNM